MTDKIYTGKSRLSVFKTEEKAEEIDGHNQSHFCTAETFY